MFSSHAIVFKYLNSVRNILILIIRLYLFSQWFENSHSCVQVKSCNYIFNPIYPFYYKIGRQSFCTGKNIHFSDRNSHFSKDIEIDISIFLSYFVLCWHIVKNYISQTRPHFIQNHKLNPVTLSSLKKYLGLEFWGLKPGFGKYEPKKTYHAVIPEP